VISFRYHVVTIAAVFLALAIGLLGGGAFLQPALQRELENRTEDLRRDLDDRLGQIDDLRLEVAGLAAFSEAALPYLAEGRLLGVPVVVVSQAGVEDEVLAQTAEALDVAGAQVLTTVSASALLLSEDPAVRQQLAEIVAEPTAAPEDLPAMAAAALASRLTTTTVPPAEDDVLTQLLSGGFLAPVGAAPGAATLEEIGPAGQLVIVLSGGQSEEPALPPEAFAVPLVEALAELGNPVAAGESLFATVPFVPLVRSAELDGVVTVDDLDQAMGGSALVLGLDRLLATGEGGDFGAKDGAEPLPPQS
jgi:hypothetical protein